jgi:uncharacterized membrane protein YphA (DoxX/SURF4 family)
MDGIREVQLGISAACSGDLFPVCRRRPVWHLGRLWSAQCGVGNYARFVDYTAKLDWFLPAAMIPAVALIATAAEALFGLLLVLGWKTRITAFLSGVLLTAFALAMTVALGAKAPLNFSVFSAAGGAFLLATSSEFPFSLDNLLRSR